MIKPKTVRFYLENGLLQSAASGQHNFISKLARVLQNAQYRVEFCGNGAKDKLQLATGAGYAMLHMQEPPHGRALTFRRVYHYPFWAIERTAQRWNWRVAQSDFPKDDVPAGEADRFFEFWRTRLFGDAPRNATKEGFVYVPLQGRLLDCRSFQHCSPMDMVEHVIRQDPQRQIIVNLHPKEQYSNREMAALTALADRTPRLRIETGQTEAFLAQCDYVVTQNSGVAFSGYFFGKPAVLFGRIDFHHIAANIQTLGVPEAFRQVTDLSPDYAGYLYWFWQTMSINAGRPDAEDKIRGALDRAGWPT
jgi:hypothetical protein